MTKDKPLVSVILSVYNDEKHIYEAVSSILNQDYENIELIIINDASSDKTNQLLQGIKDKRIYLVNNEHNMKLAHNLNVAISLSRGKYIARMDGDDVSRYNRIRMQVQYMERNPDVDVLGSCVQLFGDSRSKIEYPKEHEQIKAMLLFENAMCHPSVMFRKDSIDFQYNEQLAAGQDYELWSRIIWNKKFHNMTDFLLNYRVHSNQTRSSNGSIQKAGAQIARENMLRHLIPGIDARRMDNFQQMFITNNPKPKAMIEEIGVLLKRIEDENSIYGLFDQTSLCRNTSRVYFENWYFSLGKNDVDLSTIKNSPYVYAYYRTTLFNKLKIHIKILLKIIKILV